MPEPVIDTAASSTDRPPRRRWRLPLALKMFVTLLAMLTAAGGWIIWRGYRQLAAIEQIEQSTSGGMKGEVKCEPIGPTWLRKQLGADRMRMFDRVTQVGCYLESPNPELFREIGHWSDVTQLGIFLGPMDQSEFKSLTTLADFRRVVSQWAEQNRETETGFKHFRRSTQLKLLGFQGPLVTDRELDSIENFPNLTHLIFELAPITDVTARHFSKLKKLEFLRVPLTLITDEGLRHISELSNLNFLDLSGTQITDAGLAHLQGLPNLESVLLKGTEITNAGLAHLSRLPKLAGLGLDSEKIDDEGLRHISTLINVRILDLSRARITDSGLEHLQALTNLTSLTLTESRITDAGLEHLQALRNLEALYLNGTETTDAGLVHLKNLTNLNVLRVHDTKVTAAGVEELERALPKLHVQPPSAHLR
jgi:Leucine-rich repeat (LRR) protein